MAITSTGTIATSAASLPTGYTPPTLPDLGATVESTLYSTDVAISEADAVPATGVANIIAAVKTHFDGTYAAATLKLDVLLTINANLTLRKVIRTNTGTSIFTAGTEVYRCTVYCEYV